jgi:excisionase family DNA binding protein
MQLATDADDVDLLTIRDAADLLGFTEKAVRARVARQTIPFRRWGSRIYLRRSELSEFIRTLEGCEIGKATANVTKRHP